MAKHGADIPEDLDRDGFVLLRGLCPAGRVDAIHRLIERDLATRYDPALRASYDARSWCPALRDHPTLLALLADCGAQRLVEAWMPSCRAPERPQIAIRTGGDPSRRVPAPHIDGIAGPANGVDGPELQTFSLLVGVFLSHTVAPFEGNFTVWPGSHRILRRHFLARGRRALGEGMPDVPLGPPMQLLTSPGDVVVADYLLAHAAAPNTSDVDRRAVFFRICHTDLPERRWEHLVGSVRC